MIGISPMSIGTLSDRREIPIQRVRNLAIDALGGICGCAAPPREAGPCIMPIVETFLLIEQPRQRLGHWMQCSLRSTLQAPRDVRVVAYYDPTCDQALLDLQYDAVSRHMRLTCVVSSRSSPRSSWSLPSELSEGERARFLADATHALHDSRDDRSAVRRYARRGRAQDSATARRQALSRRRFRARIRRTAEAQQIECVPRLAVAARRRRACRSVAVAEASRCRTHGSIAGRRWSQPAGARRQVDAPGHAIGTRDNLQPLPKMLDGAPPPTAKRARRIPISTRLCRSVRVRSI